LTAPLNPTQKSGKRGEGRRGKIAVKSSTIQAEEVFLQLDTTRPLSSPAGEREKEKGKKRGA